MTSSPHIVAIPVILAFSGAYLILVMPRRLTIAGSRIALAATGLAFLVALDLARRVMLEGTLIYHMSGWPPPWGIELRADGLGAFTMVVLTLISFITVVYAGRSLQTEIAEGRLNLYYGLFLILLGAMSGMALSNDAFNIFVFAEVGAIAAAGLVAVKDKGACIEAGFKYLILSTMGSGLFLFGIAQLYMVTGYLNLDYLGAALPHALGEYPVVIAVAAGMIMVGLAVKAALYPLHVWLPDAHSTAPSPSSAVLSGLVVKIYMVVFIKMFYRTFGTELLDIVPVLTILKWAAVIGILTGSLVAMFQSDIKRMLAWSTVGQIGFIFLGISVLTPNGLSGALFHILAHAVVKSMLFLCAGAMIYASGRRRIADLHGAGLYMPVPMAAFAIGSMSMVGLPGLAGFVSKVYIAMGALDAGEPLLVFVILASSLLNAIYFLPIVTKAFFTDDARPIETRPLAKSMTWALLSLAGIAILFGVFPSLALNVVFTITDYLWGM